MSDANERYESFLGTGWSFPPRFVGSGAVFLDLHDLGRLQGRPEHRDGRLLMTIPIRTSNGSDYPSRSCPASMGRPICDRMRR